MPGPDTALEELPVIEVGIAGLVWAALFIACLGLHSVWVNTFGALFHRLGGVKIPGPFHTGIHPFGFLDDAANTVANALSSAAKKSQHNMGYFFHAAGTIQGWITRQLMGLANDTLDWMAWFEHAHLPRWTKALVYALLPPVLLHRLIMAAIHAELPKLLRTTVINTTHSVTHTVTRIIHATSGAVALPPWVIRLPQRVGSLRGDLTRLGRRVRGLEKYAGATAAVALFAAALTRLGLHWIRCRNVTKAGRAICSSDTSWLGSILTDALVIVSAISVVEFATELRALEGEAIKIMGKGIREFPG